MPSQHNTGTHPFFMTSQHNTGIHPFYIGMYTHICTHIYVHINTSQKECLCIFHKDGVVSYLAGNPAGVLNDDQVRSLLAVWILRAMGSSVY